MIGRHVGSACFIIALALILGIPRAAMAQVSGAAEHGDQKMPRFAPDELNKLLVYPQEARLQGMEGTVLVNTLVGRDGRARETVIQRGQHALLDTAALEALRKLRFAPASRNGEPIDAWVLVPVQFRLDPVHDDDAGNQDRKPDDGSRSASAKARAEESPSYNYRELLQRIVYPEAARKNNVEGVVIVRALISDAGKVVRTVIARCDDPLLCDAARDAVTATTFQPATQDGKTVAVWVEIPVHFRLK